MRVIPVALLCAVLIGCGYHLKGMHGDEQQRFAAALKRVSIEGLARYDTLRQHLGTTLHRHGVQLTGRGNASARLIIEEQQTRKIAAVIGDQAKVREYLLVMTVRFNVIEGASGHALLRDRTVSAEAFYRHDPVDLLAAASLRRDAEMRLEQEISRKIISRLAQI